MIELNTFMGLVAEPFAPPTGAPAAPAAGPASASNGEQPSNRARLPPATAFDPLWMCLSALFMLLLLLFSRRLIHPALLVWSFFYTALLLLFCCFSFCKNQRDKDVFSDS